MVVGVEKSLGPVVRLDCTLSPTYLVNKKNIGIYVSVLGVAFIF